VNVYIIHEFEVRENPMPESTNHSVAYSSLQSARDAIEWIEYCRVRDKVYERAGRWDFLNRYFYYNDDYQTHPQYVIEKLTLIN